MGELSKTTINGVSYDLKDAGAARQSHSHTKSQITDFPTSMPASDVSSWAKASSKPSYTASEVNAVATTANQSLTDTQKSNARSNIGAGTSSFSGSYNDLSNKPTIPTKTSQLTNDSGYTTNVGTVTQVKVGSTAYNPSSGVVSLPEYPTTLPASDVSSWAKQSSKPSYTASEVGAIATSEKGAASGVASLDSSGKIPSSQLPSYVDDVLEYSAKSSFPSSGESGKIYVDTSTNKTYRWSGSAYVEISESLALGETSSTAYYGDKGKTAYSHATDSSRLTTAQSSGLYKIATTAQGHIASVTAVAKSDITNLGIPGSNTNTHRPIQVNGTQVLGDNTTALNLKAGSNVSLSNSSGTVTITATDTTYGVVSTSANGLAPKVTDTSKFLKGDGTWATPANTWTAMVGATSSANGSVGYVNATPPKDGYNTKYLRADGSWQVPPNTTYSAATQSANGLMSSTDKTKLDGIATGATANVGTVTGVKVGSTSYSPSSGVVSLPAYPTSLPASDVYSWAKASSKPTYTASEVGLGNVGNFKAVSTVASQGLTSTEKSNARSNIGAGTSSFSGSYNDLSNKPTIPTTYAGSSSAGGAATSANKLNTNAGSATQPVYFSNGVPAATTYALRRTVPADAVFTDTHRGIKVNGTTVLSSNSTALNFVGTGHVNVEYDSTNPGTILFYEDNWLTFMDVWLTLTDLTWTASTGSPGVYYSSNVPIYRTGTTPAFSYILGATIMDFNAIPATFITIGVSGTSSIWLYSNTNSFQSYTQLQVRVFGLISRGEA